MPCVVPTCSTTLGNFKLFPRHSALSERWLEAIQIGCGSGVEVADIGGPSQKEICEWHFGAIRKPNDEEPYLEPKIFINGQGEQVEIDCCRLCLQFYPSCDMVSKNGKLGGIDIKSNVYESLRIGFQANDFLDLVCTECLARLELLKSIQKDFLDVEVKFQHLIKIAREPLVEVFVEEGRPESAYDPDNAINDESSNEWLASKLPVNILDVKDEGDQLEMKRTYRVNSAQPDEQDLPLKEIILRKCYICSTVLEDANALVLHLADKHSTKTVSRCEECKLDFPMLAIYNRHLSRHEQSERPHKCSFCLLCFTTLDSVKLHENRMHCTKSNVNQHTEKTKSVICESCGKPFPCMSKLKHHVRLAHSASYEKPMCNICKKNFTTKSSLERHMLVHTNEKPYSCSKCDASFRRADKLRYHIQKVHEGKNPHICGECNLEFKHELALYNHRRTVHQKKAPIGYQYHQMYQYRLVCKLCKEDNPSTYDLEQHIQTSHANETYPYYQCTGCSRGFLTNQQLAQHKPIHTDKNACKECGKRHATVQSLQKHMENTHSDGKRLDCPICLEKNYKTRTTLKAHMAMHTQDKRHVCEFCDKAFHKKYHLVTHRRIHTGEKPYECTNCLKRFSDASTVFKHKKRCSAVISKVGEEEEEDEKVDVSNMQNINMTCSDGTE